MTIGRITIDLPIDDIPQLQAILAAMGGSAPMPAPGDPGTPPAPVPLDANVYPLTMEPVANPGDPVTLGIGPDRLELRLNAGIALGDTCDIAVGINGKAIALLTVTGHTGQDGGQSFVLNGTFGPPPHRVEIVGRGAGDAGLWVNGIVVNYVNVLYYNGGPLDNRGTQPPPNATGVWDNRGLPIEFEPPIAVAPPAPVPAPPPPAPVTPPSVVTGATINGTPASGTLDELVSHLAIGDILVLPEGTFAGTAAVTVPCAIVGAGMGKTILDCEGMHLTYDKACLVPTVPGVTIQDLTIKNCRIPASMGGNACAIRQSDVGIFYTAVMVEATQCDDGLLNFGAPGILIDRCQIYGNGTGPTGGDPSERVHEQYFGGGSGSIVYQSNVVATCGPKATHALKSRAEETHVAGGVYTSNAFDPKGVYAGAVWDFPNGGIVAANNARLIIPAGDGNTLFVSWGVDDLSNPGRSVTLRNCVFEDHSGTGGIIYAAKPGCTLDVSNSTYTGDKPPSVQGWDSVIGTMTKAA